MIAYGMAKYIQLIWRVIRK